jgi:cytidylate kinase
MREMAEERGMTILELSRLAEADDSIDREIDARSARFVGSGGGFVLDARLGWHFVPDSTKVFLDVTLEVAARRVFEARRGSERENVDIDTTIAAIAARTESERQRYLEYYGLDYFDHSHYDLVIDTSESTPGEVMERILDYLELYGQRGDLQ